MLINIIFIHLDFTIYMSLYLNIIVDVDSFANIFDSILYLMDILHVDVDNDGYSIETRFSFSLQAVLDDWTDYIYFLL